MRRSKLMAASVVLLLVLSASVAFGVLPPGGTFSDDDGNTHEGNIEAIAAEGITKGCNPPANTEYCPDEPVSRGQMAAFLHRAMADLLVPQSPVEFKDDDGSIFEADIEWLGSTGVTRGCNPPTNDEYCPDELVTRGQMAAFLVRAMGYTDDGGGDLFIDDDDSIFRDDIDKLAAAGVTKGCNPPANTEFCPDDLVLRDQMASFLARALGLEPIIPPPPTTSTSSTGRTSYTSPDRTSTSSSTSTTTAPRCDPSYPDFCIPPPPPDLDCGDVGRANFTVLQPDPHAFDEDNNGIGCES